MSCTHKFAFYQTSRTYVPFVEDWEEVFPILCKMKIAHTHTPEFFFYSSNVTVLLIVHLASKMLSKGNTKLKPLIIKSAENL